MRIVRSVRQQYENYIVVRHGGVSDPERLFFNAPLNAEATGVVRGSVVSLNEKGEMVLGLPEGTGNVYPMPMFAKKNADDPDVTTGAVGKETGEIIATSTVGGVMMAYVATGGFEIESSEFDKTATYTINTALVAHEAAGKQTGKITAAATNAIYGDKTVLGIVSAVPFRSKASMNVNGTGHNRICFWSVFFPPKRG